MLELGEDELLRLLKYGGAKSAPTKPWWGFSGARPYPEVSLPCLCSSGIGGWWIVRHFRGVSGYSPGGCWYCLLSTVYASSSGLDSLMASDVFDAWGRRGAGATKNRTWGRELRELALQWEIRVMFFLTKELSAKSMFSHCGSWTVGADVDVKISDNKGAQWALSELIQAD